jgi:hypothetical protein
LLTFANYERMNKYSKLDLLCYLQTLS